MQRVWPRREVLHRRYAHRGRQRGAHKRRDRLAGSDGEEGIDMWEGACLPLRRRRGDGERCGLKRDVVGATCVRPGVTALTSRSSGSRVPARARAREERRQVREERRVHEHSGGSPAESRPRSRSRLGWLRVLAEKCERSWPVRRPDLRHQSKDNTRWRGPSARPGSHGPRTAISTST